MDESDNSVSKQDKPWLYKKGQSGNPAGRPKGSYSLKTYLTKRFLSMTDEEREAFLEGIPKDKIWEMVEGKPHQTVDHTTAGKELPQPIININGILADDSNKEGSKDEQENPSDSGWDIGK